MTESPFSTQGWNRYSYVGNSPLNFTDPSGYCFMGCFWKSAFKAIGNFFRQNWGAIVQIAAAAICSAVGGPSLGSACGALASAIVTGITSGDLGLALRSGFISAITAIAFYGIGELTSAMLPIDPLARAAMTFGSPEHLFKIAGHAGVGCLSAVASGGKCGPGGLAAGVSAAGSPLIGGAFPDPTSNAASLFGGTAASSILGGLGSVAGGGKFGNGAVTAAFGYLFNALAHEGAAAARRQVAGQQLAYCVPCVPPAIAAAEMVIMGLAGLAIWSAAPSDPLGTAIIWADGGHLSIQVQYRSGVSHTELLGEPGEITEVARATQPGKPITNPIPLPNAAAAIGFAEGMVGQEYGPYDIRHHSCYTYCSDVLRAGGLNVGPESRGLYQAIKPYLK